jgi:hypothetical protein
MRLLRQGRDCPFRASRSAEFASRRSSKAISRSTTGFSASSVWSLFGFITIREGTNCPLCQVFFDGLVSGIVARRRLSCREWDKIPREQKYWRAVGGTTRCVAVREGLLVCYRQSGSGIQLSEVLEQARLASGDHGWYLRRQRDSDSAIHNSESGHPTWASSDAAQEHVPNQTACPRVT